MCTVDLLRELNQNNSSAVLPALQQKERNENQILMSHLHLQKFLMRNLDFFYLILPKNFEMRRMYYFVVLSHDVKNVHFK